MISTSVDIIILVFNGFEVVRECLASVIAYTSRQHRIIVIDDASTDERIKPFLLTFQNRYKNTLLISNDKNLGFVKSVNKGLSLVKNHVLLLNSDTIVSPYWIENLIACMNSDAKIGIVCPLSNNATMLSVPQIARNNPLLSDSPQKISKMMEAISPEYPRIPTAVGFCMLINNQVLNLIKGFDELFSPGYAEECDFSMKVWQHGFEIVCCDNVYIIHRGAASFGLSQDIRSKKVVNAEWLSLRWPNYLSAIEYFYCLNPLRTIQEKIRLLSLKKRNPQLLMVLHEFFRSGGTEIHSKDIANGIKDNFDVTILFPKSMPDKWLDMEDLSFDMKNSANSRDKRYGSDGDIRVLAYRIENIKIEGSINGIETSLRNKIVEENFTRLLIGGNYSIVHFQHLAHWGCLVLPLIAKELGKQVLITLHDYYLFCPDYNMLLSNGNRCHKNMADSSDQQCVDCIKNKYKPIGSINSIEIKTYLHNRMQLIKSIMQFVDGLIVPSGFVAKKINLAFGKTIFNKVSVIPHGVKLNRLISPTHNHSKLQIAFVGNFNRNKGADVVIDLAKKIVDKNISLTILGKVSPDYYELLEKYHVKSYGEYQRDQLPICLKDIDVVIIPSLYDESFCMTLSETQNLGIPVIASEVGDIKNRVEHGETGFLVAPNDSSGILKYLLMLQSDRQLLRKLGNNIRKMSIKSIQENVHDYIELYYLFNRVYSQSPHLSEPHSPPLTKKIKALLKLPPLSKTLGDRDYRDWLSGQANNHLPIDSSKTLLSVQIIVTANSSNADYLTRTLQSIEKFSDQCFYISVILSDFSLIKDEWKCLPDVSVIVSKTHDPRPEINSEIKLTKANWVMVIEAGDIIESCLFTYLWRYKKRYPKWRLVYFDHDLISSQGHRYAPYFKPDINLELLRAKNYIGGAFVFEQKIFTELDSEIGISGYDFIFKVLDFYGESVVGHLATILFHQLDQNAKQYYQMDSMQVLTKHLLKLDLQAEVSSFVASGSKKVLYKIDKSALISIVIAVRNSFQGVRSLLKSIVEFTSYKNYELIVIDNHSENNSELKELRKIYPFKLVTCSQQAAPAAINNKGAEHANGKYLLFINDQTEVLDAQWLDVMLGYMNQPAIGIIGCRLFSSNNNIIHDGYVLGMGKHGIAGDIREGGINEKHNYYLDHTLARYVSAVSNDCLMIDKQLFFQLKEFDAINFPFLFFDVDLCLKAYKEKKKVVFTPYTGLKLHAVSSLISHGSPINRDIQLKHEKQIWFNYWSDEIKCDPFYNKNLSLQKYGKVETKVKIPIDKCLNQTLRVLAFPYDLWASGHYRVREPLSNLHQDKLCDLLIYNSPESKFDDSLPSLAEVNRLDVDVIFMHNSLGKHQLSRIEEYRRYNASSKIFSIDDLIDSLPAYNPYAKTNYPNMAQHIKKAMANCDRVVVSTEPLAEAYAKYHSDIVIVPNRISAQRWLNLSPLSYKSPKLRIGWAGAVQHLGDLEIIEPVIKKLADKVDWIFLGMCPESFKPYVKEFYAMVPYGQYPQKLAELGLDIAIAPLCDNAYNHAKSNIKILEYGILGYPVICSDITPYRNAPVQRVKNNPAAWIEAINDWIDNPVRTKQNGILLKNWVLESWLLEKNAKDWNEVISR